MPHLKLNQQADSSALSEIIQQLLLSTPESAPLPHDERREQPRFAVSMSAMICYDAEAVWMPIFMRDMSESGLGFRHGVPLPEGIATISFRSEDGQSVELAVEILWCAKDGRSMYISGSRFLAVAENVASPW